MEGANEESSYTVYVGIDWATREHQVCVIREGVRKETQQKFEHSGEGLRQLGAWLRELGGDATTTVAVGIETPRGPVVETLVEQGFHVYALNPKQLDRFRDRFTMAGAKSDELDARVLAASLKTDLPLFRRVRLDDADIIQLREASRTQDSLQEGKLALCNKLRDILLRYFPVLLALCPAADEPWLWTLLERASTPSKAAGLRRSTLEHLLRDHRIQRFDAAALQARLRETPVTVAPGVADAASAHVEQLLPHLWLHLAQEKAYNRRLKELLKQVHRPEGSAAPANPKAAAETEPGQECKQRDVDLVLSLPGIGTRVAATLFAEASQPIAQRDYSTLACAVRRGGRQPGQRAAQRKTRAHLHAARLQPASARSALPLDSCRHDPRPVCTPALREAARQRTPPTGAHFAASGTVSSPCSWRSSRREHPTIPSVVASSQTPRRKPLDERWGVHSLRGLRPLRSRFRVCAEFVPFETPTHKTAPEPRRGSRAVSL